MKKLVFTDKSDVRLGFELECVIRDGYPRRDADGNRMPNTSSWTSFARRIYNLKSDVVIGYDGSINNNGTGFGPNARTCELRTPPLPPKSAMKLLKRLFDIINEFGATNASCGLHVNISSSHRTKMNNFNPLPFLSSKLWNQILASFGRRNNVYCRPVIRMEGKPTRVNILQSLMDSSSDKYHCVNLCHWGDGKQKTSRIEVRGFGNKDYTKKFHRIAPFVKRIETLFKLSCSPRLPLAPTLNV